MTAESLFAELRSELLGEPVTFTRLAANSFLVYVNAEPASKTGVTIWLEPTWHLCSADGVYAGSRQAQTDDKSEFHRIGDSLKVLMGKRVRAIEVDPRTFDLSVQLEGEFLLRTFACDPGCDELWHLRDNATGDRVSASPKGLFLEEERK